MMKRPLLTALFATATVAAIGLTPCFSAEVSAADNTVTNSSSAADAPAPSVAPATDAQILEAARAANIFYQHQVGRLLAMLADRDEAVRIKALRRIGNLQDPSLTGNLLPWLQSSNRSAEEINAAINALPNDGGLVAVPALKNLIKHENATVRVNAMNALTRMQSLDRADYMSRANDDVNAIRASSSTNLGVLKITEAAVILTKGLTFDGNPHVRRMCAISLGLLADPTHGPVLTDALADANPGVRRYAAEALVKINYTRAIPHFLMAMEANVAADHIARCLTLMCKEDFGFHSNDNFIARNEAIEKGFTWWTLNSKELNR